VAVCVRMGHKVLVAGDRSHSGKSTVSLGLLISLLEIGYPASELAYIKPATQCVSSTLTARFCESVGIASEHIGPLVFYRGFTREYLDGESGEQAESDRRLVRRCARAVEKIAKGKSITVIDGVGYPSVGAVVGCSSADLAVACAAPVLLVGKPGVGDAIDSFQLCARYFEAQRVPVLGAVFNKVPLNGYYGLEQCSRYVRKYMTATRPRQRVYGLLPKTEKLGTLAGEEACGLAFKHPPVPESAGPLTEEDREAIELVRGLFREHVQTKQLVEDLKAASARPSGWVRQLPMFPASQPEARRKQSQRRYSQ